MFHADTPIPPAVAPHSYSAPATQLPRGSVDKIVALLGMVSFVLLWERVAKVTSGGVCRGTSPDAPRSLHVESPQKFVRSCRLTKVS